MIIKIMIGWLANEFKNIVIYIKSLLSSLQIFTCLFSQKAETHSFSHIHSISDAKF